MGKGELIGICTCSTNPMIGGRKRGGHWGNCPLFVSPEVGVGKSSVCTCSTNPLNKLARKMGDHWWDCPVNSEKESEPRIVCPSCGSNSHQVGVDIRAIGNTAGAIDYECSCCGVRFNNHKIHSEYLKAHGLVRMPGGVPHYGCNYLGIDGELCHKCGQLVKAENILMTFSRMIQEWGTDIEQLVKSAHEEGALAMAHYYHGDYASDEFKKDHGERALRPEHLAWAKQILADARRAKG